MNKRIKTSSVPTKASLSPASPSLFDWQRRVRSLVNRSMRGHSRRSQRASLLTSTGTVPSIESLEQRLVLAAFTPSVGIPDGEAGSLRDAINQANVNGEDDVISLSAGTWNIGISNVNFQDNENLRGDFDIIEPNQTLVIEGAGTESTIIDAHTFDRHFQVFENATLVLRNLSLIDGFARDNGFPDSQPHERTATGGSILVERGHVVLEGVKLDGNLAMGTLGSLGLDGKRGYGGAIAVVNGSVSVVDTMITNNQAKGGEGGEGPNGQNGTEGAEGSGADGQEGEDAGSGGNAIGGAIYAEDSNITISGSIISNNNATGGPAGSGGDGGNGATGGSGGEGGAGGQGGHAFGGAIYLDTGTLSISDSEFENNFAFGGNSGRGGRGGRGGQSTGGGTAENGANGGFSDIAGRAQGGAIYMALGNVSISTTTIASNFAQGGDGANGGIGGLGGGGGNGTGGAGGNGGGGGEGGVAHGGGVFALRGSLELTDSTVSHNYNDGGNGGVGGAGGRAGAGDLGGNGGNGGRGGTGGDGQGGGIYSLNVNVTATNSTLSTNYTKGGIGGPGGDAGGAEAGGREGRRGSEGTRGLSEGGGLWVDDATTATITNATILLNEAKDGGDGGGVFNVGSQQIIMHNTLIAQNVFDDDFVGEINPFSTNNAIGNGTRLAGIQHGINGHQIGDLDGVLDFQVGPLADNGGPTLTHTLIEGSSAIDGGNAAVAPSHDQRGIPRPLQSPVDVGAFEAQRILSVDLPTGGGSYSLRAEASDLVIKDQANADVFRYEYAALLHLTINASGDGDTLVVDFTNGTAVPINGIRFDAKSNSDSLEILGATSPAVNQTLTTKDTGLIEFDGHRIEYENLPSVMDRIAAASRSLILSPDDDIATVSTSSEPNSMDVLLGTSTITLTQPTNAFSINAGQGADSITLTGLDLAAPTVEVDGGDGNDVINALAAGRSLTINGADGNDEITGSAFADVIDGGAGDDRISANNGADVVRGGVGVDWIFGDGGDDDLSGGDGDDFLFGGSGADFVRGDAGNDNASGQGGSDDSVSGGLGDDTIVGGGGSDFLVEAADTDFVLTTTSLTGLGTDLVLHIELAYLTGGPSANVIDARGFVGDTILDGAGGNDNIQGSQFYDVIIGNTGNDIVHANAGPDVVIGGGGHDKLNGGNGADYLRGNGGNDVLNGDADNDILIGSSGADILNGGQGADLLNGDEGVDQLNGNEDSDVLNGGADDDILAGNDGDDQLNGEAGNDLINGNDGKDTVHGGQGHDRIFGDAGSDELLGGIGGDEIHGGLDADVLLGEDGNDVLFGNDGNDAIYGGNGNDAILGDAGDDFLLGDLGEDALIGGTGQDVMLGSGGSDLLLGQDGNDVLKGQGATDIVSGGAGADSIINPGGVDVQDESATFFASFDPEGGQLTIVPEAGTSVLVKDSFDLLDITVDGVRVSNVANVAVADVTRILVRGSDGDDTVDLHRVSQEMFTSLEFDGVLMLGGDGDDVLTGTEFRDRIEGGAGNDVIESRQEPDLILAGSGDDVVSAGRGEDVIFGGAGNDYIDGGDNADYIDGGDGDDVLRGRSGADTIRGNNGNDSIAGHRANDYLVGDMGNDVIIGGDDNDILFGGGGNDIVLGDTGNDVVTGNGGIDKLAGGHGFGNADAGDVIVGDVSEIDENYVHTGNWIEDI